MEAFVQSQQSAIVSALGSLDITHKFRTDTRNRPAGGGGISCVLQGGMSSKRLALIPLSSMAPILLRY